MAVQGVNNIEPANGKQSNLVRINFCITCDNTNHGCHEHVRGIHPCTYVHVQYVHIY